MFTDYKLLLETVPAAIVRIDSNGYIIYANPEATSLTGYLPSELKNRTMDIFSIVKNNQLKIDYELDMTLKSGRYVSVERKQKKNGIVFWAETTYTVIYDSEKNFVGYNCMILDVTEKINEQVALRNNEEKYKLMVEGVTEYAIFMLNLKGEIITWNEGAKRTKGYTADEIIGKHFSIFYTAEDLAINKPANELIIAEKEGRYEEEGWRVKKNGSLFWANVVITALFNYKNQLIGFSKVTRDLTQRKSNEEVLRQSEERYRSLVQQVGDYGIFMLDENGRIISWNEGAKKIKGYNAEEIIGKYFSIFYPQEDLLIDKPARELKIAKAYGKYEEEGWRLRKDGSRFWANVVITAVFNNEGILIGYSKVTRDLTEKKESERALRESHERFRKLADELRSTNLQLTHTNQELEQFTSIVSHDLQEPVRTIKSFLQLIDIKLNEGQTADLKTYIDKSIIAANRMKALIQNLLEYSQLSREEVNKEEVSVNEIVNEAIQNLRSAIEMENAQISIENQYDTVYGDRVQLVQLVQNLLSNALKFTEAKEPIIKIKSAKENGHVIMSVSDNGIGISNEDQNKVFEIFRRLNTKKSYPGTGIGLAICKKIVDRHKGRIWPESNGNNGTTFYFTLNENSN
jgi:PAS domain S-box-containing protein